MDVKKITRDVVKNYYVIKKKEEAERSEKGTQ